MKKILIIFAALFAVIGTSCSSCNGPQEGGDQTDGDTIAQPVDSLLEVTGVAIDGAMNSIALQVGEDTVFFSYPELDSEHRGSWEIGDSVKVCYVETENGDSVTDVNAVSEIG